VEHENAQRVRPIVELLGLRVSDDIRHRIIESSANVIIASGQHPMLCASRSSSSCDADSFLYSPDVIALARFAQFFVNFRFHKGHLAYVFVCMHLSVRHTHPSKQSPTLDCPCIIRGAKCSYHLVSPCRRIFTTVTRPQRRFYNRGAFVCCGSYIAATFRHTGNDQRSLRVDYYYSVTCADICYTVTCYINFIADSGALFTF
jgi:hypothetical protein